MRSELPLPDYIQYAAKKNTQALKDAKKWQGPAWTFCRYMKGRPDFEGLDAQQAGDFLDELLEGMFPKAEDPWAEIFGCVDSQGNSYDPFVHFIECWNTVEHGLGEAPMEKALRLAKKYPLELKTHRSKRWEPFRRFLSVCYWLDILDDDEPLFVPVRKFAEVLKVGRTSISVYRKLAEQAGYLLKVKEHEGRRKATEFRFNLDALEPEIPDETKADDGEWGEIE